MGFLKPKNKPPKPMEQIEDKLKPVPVPEKPVVEMPIMPMPGEIIEDNPVLFKDDMANTTDPQDEGKGSKRKGKGKGGTILTSVTGVSGQPQLGKPSLLGGSY